MLNSDYNASEAIEHLLDFGLQKQMMEQWDLTQIRNQLLELLRIDEPHQGPIETFNHISPVPILQVLLEYAVTKGIIQNTTTERDLLDSKLMAQLMPRQSELIKDFCSIRDQKGIRAATDYFYQLSQDSNYIRMDRIAKNKRWFTETKYGKLEITVNLSKPEKDPKEIEAEKNAPSIHYPKCLLCLENVGYAGRVNHPGRSNHRVIPIELLKEQWYFQYSPYVYYNEHAIVFSEEHRPMAITTETIQRLLEFVEQVPHYFIGSNADLPIVGGSILSHDHFQGGCYRLPMERAGVMREYHHPLYPEVKIQMIQWPLSVIRVISEDHKTILTVADTILSTWRNYSDSSVGITAYSHQTPHNTISPIARFRDGKFELDLALRNNRTDKMHPDGIFHPHRDLHHIKKENIGLIEAMGLAILPARLLEEMGLIQEVLCGVGELGLYKEYEGLQKHSPWMEELVEQYGTSLSREEAETILQEEVGNKFTQVLESAGVYKQTDEGHNAFERFIKKCIYS